MIIIGKYSGTCSSFEHYDLRGRGSGPLTACWPLFSTAPYLSVAGCVACLPACTHVCGRLWQVGRPRTLKPHGQESHSSHPGSPGVIRGHPMSCFIHPHPSSRTSLPSCICTCAVMHGARCTYTAQANPRKVLMFLCTRLARSFSLSLCGAAITSTRIGLLLLFAAVHVRTRAFVLRAPQAPVAGGCGTLQRLPACCPACCARPCCVPASR